LRSLEGSMQESLAVVQRISHLSTIEQQTELAELSSTVFELYYQKYMQLF
jgi:hypothetical protein